MLQFSHSPIAYNSLRWTTVVKNNRIFVCNLFLLNFQVNIILRIDKILLLTGH